MTFSKTRIALSIAALTAASTYAYLKVTENDVPVELGSPAVAQPMPGALQPDNPWLAESQRSSMHGGSYNRNITDYPGPAIPTEVIRDNSTKASSQFCLLQNRKL